MMTTLTQNGKGHPVSGKLKIVMKFGGNYQGKNDSELTPKKSGREIYFCDHKLKCPALFRLPTFANNIDFIGF